MKLFINSHILDNVQISGGYSKIIELNQRDVYSIPLGWTGTVSGTFSLSVSNETVKFPERTPTEFIPVTSTSGSLGSTSGSFMLDNIFPSYRFARLDITAASGTGVMNAWYMGKGL